jgi:hypothetical protein
MKGSEGVKRRRERRQRRKKLSLKTKVRYSLTKEKPRLNARGS